ncbi:MAG: FtsX-like permease family protein [Brachymonas sp.]|nr:FtsX-like permease family protein [Brachymonas sp.]
MTAKEPAFWRLAWRTLWRDVRAGELRLLLVALTLAVAALTAVAFFSNRLDAALRRDAAQLLGGDLVISGDNPLPAAFTDKAQALGLRMTQTQTFPTMARATEDKGGAGRLVYLKAVDDAYPLRGVLRVSSDSRWEPGMPDAPAAQAIQPGQVWVEAPLLETLGLQVGDTLLLGNSALHIAHVLTQEPDQGGGFISFAPRVLLHAADLPATGLVQPASRVNYRLAMVGQAAAVRDYTTWARAEVDKPGATGLRVRSLEDDNPRMQEALGRASNFLNLVALLTALLSAVAVVLGTRSFAARHLDGCAMLRVLGLRQRTIALAYSTEFVLAGLAGSVLGIALGYGVHYGFVALLGGMLRTDLPPPGIQPVLLGLGVGMTLLLAFGLPPVLQMADTPALRVIRRELGRLKPASALVIAAGVIGFAALLLAASTDLKMGGVAVGGFAAAVLLFVLLGFAAVWLLQQAAQTGWAQGLPQGMRLAIRQLGARPTFVVVQISSLCLGLMALALLVILRTDLVQSWRDATPADAHNRYVINILPEQATDFQQTLRDGGVGQYDWYPMVRGRLIAINGKQVLPSHYADEQAQRLLQREFNLSYSAEPPPWNPITQGAWRQGDAHGISMEEGIMKTLSLKMGDRVVFDMGGVQRESTITSVRKVNWSSMHVNFFAMYPLPSIGDEVAATWITSYRSPTRVPGQPSLDYRLLQSYPNITQVDMDSTLHQVQTVLDKVIRAVELLFGFGLAAGALVLFATVASTREERAHEFAIMRALGARTALLQRVQNAELLAVGAVAGLLAGAVALVIGWALAHYVFEFDWTPAWWILPATAATGALLAWAAGWWSLRNVLKQPVVQSLRAAV